MYHVTRWSAHIAMAEDWSRWCVLPTSRAVIFCAKRHCKLDHECFVLHTIFSRRAGHPAASRFVWATGGISQTTSSMRIAISCEARWRWSAAGTVRTLALPLLPLRPSVLKPHHWNPLRQPITLLRGVAATVRVHHCHRIHRIHPSPSASAPTHRQIRPLRPPIPNSPSSNRLH